MNQTATQLDPGRLIQLLTKQRDFYHRLRELSQQQRTLISGDRPEMLLAILRERQELVTALAQLNNELAPYRRNWDAMYAALPELTRTEASQILQEINSLLRVILRSDQEDSALLSARKQAVADGLAGIAGARVANAAYAQQHGMRASRSAADVSG